MNGKKKLNEWWLLKNGKYKKKTCRGLKTQMYLEPVHLHRATAPAAAPAASAAAAAAVLVVVDNGGGS